MRANGSSGGGAATMQSIQAQNLAARNAILASAITMMQPTYQQTFTTGTLIGGVFPIQLRNVGMQKRIIIELNATVTVGGTEVQTRSAFGPANFLSNVTLTDLSNQQRVNTTGWHLFSLATVRRQLVHGAAYVTDTPCGVGSNYPIITAPATFAAGNQTIRMFYEVPLAYSDFDLRGAIYSNVVNATYQIQLTVNPNFFVASTADDTLAVYKSNGATLGTMSSLTIKIYQVYLDQLPQANGGPILPALDLSTTYMLQNTVASNIVANQDNPIPYANFRQFMSTCAIYNQNGTRNTGSDIAAWKLQVANYTNILNVDPYVQELGTRNLIGDDFIPGMYYFDHRTQPINTNQWGNMELVINPSTAAASSTVLLGYEMLALAQQVVQAGSLPGTAGG